jgi:hypothetical protein
MRKSRWMLFVMMLVVAAACTRMPLYDLEKNVQLDLDLKLDLDLDVKIEADVDVEIDTVIKMPEHMKVCFYAPQTGNLSYTEFVGPLGGPVNTPSGTYQMVVYAFGTEYIQIRGEGNINTIEAYTSDIASTKGDLLRAFSRANGDIEEPKGTIIYAPDHMLVARKQVVIPDVPTESNTIILHAEASDLVETYGFEVQTVIGAEYIESCEAFVTNQARSSFFGIGKVNPEPATIWFPVGVDRKRGVLFTTFNTFGKLPGESRCFLHMLIRDTDGKEYHVSEDITDGFLKPEHIIVIDEEIKVPEPASHGGGITPTVDPWDEENHNVPIG